MEVQEIMTAKVITVGQDEPVTAAARLLRRWNLGALPVTDSTGRLRGVIEKNGFRVGGGLIGVTASFGISELLYYVPDPLQTSYKQADNALYAAKSKGKNCIVIASELELSSNEN